VGKAFGELAGSGGVMLRVNLRTIGRVLRSFTTAARRVFVKQCEERSGTSWTQVGVIAVRYPLHYWKGCLFPKGSK